MQTQRGWVAVGLAVVLVVALSGGAYLYQSLAGERERLSTELDTVQAERDRLERQLEQARTRRDDLAEALQQARSRLGETSAQLDDLAAAEAERDALSGRLEQAEAEVAALEADLAEVESELAASRSARERAEDDLAQARAQLEEREASLAEVAAERESVADQYRQAREQLALERSRNQDQSETISELQARLDREQAAMDELQSRLQSLSNERETLVSQLEDGTTVIKLPENILFDTGSATLGESGRQTLRLLADALQSFPNHLISVQGHSDSRSIASSLAERFPTNWELSAARAAAAVRVLAETGIDPARMQAVGYADSRPLVEETDADSRRENRRIEVLLYPDAFRMQVLDEAASDA